MMASKVVADPATRIIEIVEPPTAGTLNLDLVTDIYSPLKDDWRATGALQRVRFPFRTIGDPTGAGQIGPYVFLDNLAGWRMLPYDTDHEVVIKGNLIGESAVAGVERPVWNSRPSRTITVRERLSAQALTVSAGALAPSIIND